MESVHIEIVIAGAKKFLNIENNLFYKHSDAKKNKKVTYWRCQMCDARATTELKDDNKLQLRKGIYIALILIQN